MSAVTDFGPEYDEQGNLLIKHDYDFLKKRSVEIEMWNDFIVDNEGEVLVKLRIGDDSKLKDRLKDWVYDGVAQIIDNNHVLLSGKWKDNNDLYLGDLQKSAINVLKTVLKLKY